MLTTEAEIIEMLRKLPKPALDEVKAFLNSLADRYQQSNDSLSPGMNFINKARGKARSGMTTDEIMALTRGEE